MTRDDEIQAIVEVGRRTRAPVPRGLWIAAAVVGGICITGLALALLGDAPRPSAPATAAAPHALPAPAAARHGDDGLATGLVVGAVGGLVIGLAIARQRRDHSSRSRP